MQTKPTSHQRTGVLLLFSSLIAFAVSCKKDKDHSPAPPPTTTTKLAEYKNGDEFVRFDYNADGTVRKATVKSDITTGGNIVDFSITYNAQKKVASMQSTAGETIVPVYENNVLIRADVFEGTEQTGYTSYYYKDGNLDFAIIYWGSGVNYEPLIEFDFAYNAQGNLQETVALLAGDIPGRLDRAGHIEYEHDQKTNPLYAHRDLLALFWHAVSKNNIVLENHFDADLRPEDRFVYTYSYKNNGLPEHATVKQGLPGNPITTSNVDFIYK